MLFKLRRDQLKCLEERWKLTNRRIMVIRYILITGRVIIPLFLAQHFAYQPDILHSPGHNSRPSGKEHPKK